MKVLFLITKYKGETEITSEETVESIKKTRNDFLEITLEDKKDLYFESINKIKSINDYDFVCLIQNGSILNVAFNEIIKELVDDNKTLYLPLIVLKTDKITGVLNTTLWTSEVIEYSILDHDSSLKQINTTLYGALIPVELIIDENNYNKEIELYQHFYFLNKVTNKEVTVKGIPKILLDLDYDLSYESYDKEDKIKWFKLCRKEFEQEPTEIIETLETL